MAPFLQRHLKLVCVVMVALVLAIAFSFMMNASISHFAAQVLHRAPLQGCSGYNLPPCS